MDQDNLLSPEAGSWELLAWGLATVIMVTIIWRIAIRIKLKVEQNDDLVRRISGIIGWSFMMNIGVYDIIASYHGRGALVMSAFLMFISSLTVLLINHAVWEKVVSGLTVILVCFGIVSIPLGVPANLSLLMGATVGALCGQAAAGTLILTGIYKLPARGGEEHVEEESKYKVRRV